MNQNPEKTKESGEGAADSLNVRARSIQTTHQSNLLSFFLCAIPSRSHKLKFLPEPQSSSQNERPISVSWSSWVTRARLMPSRRAMSARLRLGLRSNSLAQEIAFSTMANGPAGFEVRDGLRDFESLPTSVGIRNRIGATQKAGIPIFASGKPTANRSRNVLESSYLSVLRPATLTAKTCTSFCGLFLIISKTSPATFQTCPAKFSPAT
jgi:hypothetical protein